MVQKNFRIQLRRDFTVTKINGQKFSRPCSERFHQKSGTVPMNCLYNQRINCLKGRSDYVLSKYLHQYNIVFTKSVSFYKKELFIKSSLDLSYLVLRHMT